MIQSSRFLRNFLLLLVPWMALILVLPAFAFEGGADGQDPTWWFRLRSTGYAFQTEERSGAVLDRFGAYQQFDGSVAGLAGGRLAIRASGRAYDDLYLAERDNDRARLYTAYGDVKITPELRAKIGRQFLHEGAAGLTVDGLWLSAKPRGPVEVRAWGGARAPIAVPYRDRVGDFGDDAVLGARVLYDPCRFWRSSVSFAYLEKDDVVSARPLGFETTFRARFDLRATGRAAYDMLEERWTRVEGHVQFRRTPECPVITLQFVDRYPTIERNSYFSRFDAYRARIGRASIRREHRSGFGAEIDYMGAFVEERTSTRVGGAALFPLGRIGYSVRVGDAGEESRWFGDIRVTATPWLSLEGGATFTTYALLQDAPSELERDLTVAFGRVRILARRGAAITLEIQSVDTPFFEEDIRVLGGLDLTMGRGRGAFGLGRGGWL
ncbi:MAG: hypothetical protein ABIK65_06960 [Candidatus Eisenbacteria bacterium]